MHDFIFNMIAAGGYLGIFFLMVLENVIPPIPSELIMGLGGIAVARGHMEFLPLLLSGTAGSVLGNWVWYWLGNRLGYARLRPFVDRWGRWLTLEWEDVEKAQRFFQKHGQWVVFFTRFSPLLRTIISLPAGLAHMSLWRFLAYTAAGSAIWNVFLILGGHWLGDTFAEAEAVIGWATIAAAVVVVILYIHRVIRWHPR